MTTQRARIVGLTALCSIAALSVVSAQQLAFADATEEGPFYSSKHILKHFTSTSWRTLMAQ